MQITERTLKKWPKDSSPEREGQSHYPVMFREVLDYLNLTGTKVIVDCTLGMGSHALRILPFLSRNSLYIGLDKDAESLKMAQERLKGFPGRVICVKEDFRNLDVVLNKLNIPGADNFLFDLGISSYQLDEPDRGFSFNLHGPLDMRMDRQSFVSAYDLVNNLSERELQLIFEKFGQERFSRRIAHLLVEKRRHAPLFDTEQLKSIIITAIPVKNRHNRLHSATRVFQALRIAVNRELDCLKEGLNKALERLNPKGRIVVLSFHSLEDRIVKICFRDFAAGSSARILTKKPIAPGSQEVGENKRSRSAKLRAIEKL